MVFPRSPAFRLTTRRARSLTSSLFIVTSLACVLTVSASDVLPCPAHPRRGRFADDGDSSDGHRHPPSRRTVVVEKRPRRWIEERHRARATIHDVELF
ncbi:hypothetical protein BC826DRAFT_913044 [Russula brevipes]|nr:hypothetical protein BC826DRAFT_913044 [Russula brevipes]